MVTTADKLADSGHTIPNCNGMEASNIDSPLLQLPDAKGSMFCHPYGKAVPRYLRPGALARYRTATQLHLSGHYVGNDAHKRPRYTEAALVLGRDVGGSGQLQGDGSNEVVLAPPRVYAPYNGQRKKHYAPRVMPRHSGPTNVGMPGTTGSLQHSEEFIALEEGPSGEDKEDEEDLGTAETTFHDLPLEMLVRIVCYLKHSELQVAFFVSKQMREAANIARLMHFNFTTPDHRSDSRAHAHKHLDWASYHCAGEAAEASAQAGEAAGPACLVIPPAPRHAPRPAEVRPASAELRKIAAPLFQTTPKQPTRPMVQNNTPKQTPHRTAGRPPGLPLAPSSLTTPHRVLFNVSEEVLCMAVENQSLYT